MQLTIADLEQAWASKDPALVDMVLILCTQSDPEPEQPIRQEALTFERFIETIHSLAFQKKSAAEKKAWRIAQLQLLEADAAEVTLSERLKLHKFLFLLWDDGGFYARSVLLELIRRLPLVYGPWRAFKHLYKLAEIRNDYPLLAELIARCDTAERHEFSQATLHYMRRRAWRYLRRLGNSLPVAYPEAAIHVLAAYPDNTRWQETWVANHIFHHQSRQYGRVRFRRVGKLKLEQRAFAESWQRAPEPLLRLLSMARAETVRSYASLALRHDFAIVLRDIDPQWLIELGVINQTAPSRSAVIDEFIAWALQNAPKLEQHQFRELGLHRCVIGLLESSAKNAQAYAIGYVNAHARDLPLEDLIRLAANPSTELTQLVQQLLSERDPRENVGLDTWGQLLEFPQHYKFAANILHKHFGRQELTPDWFQQRLVHATEAGIKFSQHYLFELHPVKKLGLSYFQDLLELLDYSQQRARQIVQFVTDALIQLDLKGLDLDTVFLQTMLLNPATKDSFQFWLFNDTLKASQVPLDFYKALAYEPDWQQHEFISGLRQSDKTWAQVLIFDEQQAETIRELLADVRRFAPADLGFDWLLELVQREEKHYHDFAVERMIKAFAPADFAPTEEISEDTPDENSAATVDLQKQSFLFTGQLKTMTRKEAQNKVNTTNGANANSVTAKLDYLVIGDEGSPLYGNGRKGSKQVKAESLIEKGSALKIISETAFLQMLAGQQRTFSSDRITTGCQTLWQMITDKPESPLNRFALKYFRLHHPDISLKLTDRPVDPGAEIPTEFATLERFLPLFDHPNSSVRQLALDYAEYEFARWSPTAADLIRLCDSPHQDVREFVLKALLAPEEDATKHYRIDCSTFNPAEVYSFCESRQAHTRQLGMTIIQQHDHFQLPENLFQLTESPDRELRAFVVRLLWALYRRYSTTRHWQPRLPVMASMSKTDQAKQVDAEKKRGKGLPKRPPEWPADTESLRQLLRRWLYELPPGRLGNERLATGLKPLSASAAKKALIETLRDLALDDRAFAEHVLPLFENFTQSHAAMEKAACLVATTRILQQYPELATTH